MAKFHTLLFALLSCAIFPFAQDSEHFFLWPKVFALLGVCVANLQVLLQARYSQQMRIWMNGAGAWFPWLLMVWVATVFAVHPVWSILGHPSRGVGAAWWSLIALFSISTTAVARFRKELISAQFDGIQLGCLINCLALIVQSFAGWEARGFFRHPAHLAGLLLLALAVLMQSSGRSRWQSFTWPLVAVYVIALIGLGYRAALIAVPILLIIKIGWRRALPIVISCLIALGIYTSSRQIEPLPAGYEKGPMYEVVRDWSSDRVWLYTRGIRYFLKSTVIGHGWQGLHIEQALSQCEDSGGVTINRVTYRCADGEKPHNPAQHSHNLILNKLVETGFLGLFGYGWLLFQLLKGKISINNGYVLVAYTVWVMFWPEGHYYSWLFYWSLSRDYC